MDARRSRRPAAVVVAAWVSSLAAVVVAAQSMPKPDARIWMAHSTALHAAIKGRAHYFVGPLARFNLNHEKLPPAARQISVHLNPLDLDLVRGISPRGRSDVRWELVDDTSLTRGGCVVHSDIGSLDARIETQLAALERALRGDR